jgi:peptide/nickel transport system permease protein
VEIEKVAIMKKEFLFAVIKRIATSIIVIWLMISFIFVLLRLAPGDPTQKFISPQLTPELVNHISQSFNLDKPIITQYLIFVKNLFTGDFGISYNYRQPVFSVIQDYFLFTLFFSTLSFLIQMATAYFLVKISYQKVGGFTDRIFSKSALIVFAIPSFVLGVMLVYLFSVQLDWLPTSGIKSIYYSDFSFLGKLLDYATHLILPLITLSLAGIAVFYRYLRDSVTEIFESAFVVNLRASGFSEKEIFRKHIIPNAIRPLISVAGIEYGILLGGTLITEVIFSLPGMGRLTIDAIFNRDFPLVIGCSFIAGVMMIITNFIADLIKIKIDKRLVKDLIQ